VSSRINARRPHLAEKGLFKSRRNSDPTTLKQQYTEDMAIVPGAIDQAISPTVKLSGNDGVDLAVEPRFSSHREVFYLSRSGSSLLVRCTKTSLS
jgi:hypothetical protein